MTNFEKIKQMTVEKMAKFINTLTTNWVYQFCDECPINQNTDGCVKHGIEEWLNQEVEWNLIMKSYYEILKMVAGSCNDVFTMVTEMLKQK